MPFARLSVHRPDRSVADPAIAVPAAWVVTLDGRVATERLFVLRHDDDPIQIAHCRHCGTPWCANGGCVLVRRVDQAIVWMPPWLEPRKSDDEWGNYIIGGETVWLSAGDIAWMKLRYAPIPAVATHPVWFALADYRQFISDLGFDADREFGLIKPLSETETDFLLRVALSARRPRSEPSTLNWEELELSIRSRTVDPPDHPDGVALLALVSGPGRTLTIDAVSPSLDCVECRIIERTSEETHTRLALTRTASATAIWHDVGNGCWGRVAAPR